MTFPPKYLEMRNWADSNDDMPDGAFFALAEETEGWDVDDWVWYAGWANKDPHFQTTPTNK